MQEIDQMMGQDIAYIPLEIRHYRKGKHRARKSKAVPVCPRMVFCPVFIQDHLHSLKHAQGALRDATGAIYTIPERQMTNFKRKIATWTANASGPKPPQIKSFAELAAILEEMG